MPGVTPVCVPSPNVGEHGYVTIVDVNGYPIGTIATSDGALFGSISGESQFLYSSGGPPLIDGSPSQYTFERARSYMGKGAALGVPISSTVSGDTVINFSSAPKTLMQGTAIRLHGGSIDEYVQVADSFAPSATTVAIPLKWPVVNTGLTTASWDIFSPGGPSGSTFTPVGVGLSCIAMPTAFPTTLAAANSAASDDAFPYNVLETMPGLFDGSLAQRQRTPNTFKPFNAQAVTASSANTPTAIWTPTAGKKFRLMGYWFSTTAAAGLVLHDLATVGGGGLLNIPSPIYAAAGIIQSPPLGNGVISGLVNNKLWIDATAATTLTGFVFGTEES